VDQYSWEQCGKLIGSTVPVSSSCFWPFIVADHVPGSGFDGIVLFSRAAVSTTFPRSHSSVPGPCTPSSLVDWVPFRSMLHLLFRLSLLVPV
jgi:hypothetical protein